MDVTHPIDAEIRAWLDAHVKNRSELSVATGRSSSWLHKYINGDGQATIDDLVRLAGLLMGLNLPALTGTEQQLLKAFRLLAEPDQLDLVAYAELRARRARRGPLKGSSAPSAQTPPATASKARGKR